MILVRWHCRYVEGLATGEARSGIVKLKAPAGWEPDLQTKEDRYNPSQLDLTITRPLQQVHSRQCIILKNGLL